VRVLLGILIAITSWHNALALTLRGAVALFSQGSHSEALPTIQKLAKDGNSEAHYFLALAYGAGSGVPKDGDLMMESLKASAIGGYPPAQFSLGQLFETGALGQIHHIRANEW